jgi:hypothetical protein
LGGVLSPFIGGYLTVTSAKSASIQMVFNQ